MDYEIYPLATTHAEWSMFIGLCQEAFSFSPTRGVDACHLTMDDPASFLGSMDMENKPLEVLRDEHHPAHQHFSISFLALLDEEACLQLLNTDLRVLCKRQRRQTVCILTGTMAEWFSAICTGCRESSEYELRWIMNRVLAHLERVGFVELFSRFKKQQLHDETFVLKT